MSGEYLAQSKHQISANRLHKKVRLRIGFRRRTFFVGARQAIICIKIRNDTLDNVAIFSIVAASPAPAFRLAIGLGYQRLPRRILPRRFRGIFFHFFSIS